MKRIGKEAWTPCNAGRTVTCVSEADQRRLGVTNTGSHRTLCGDVLFLAEGTTPWEYRNLTGQTSYAREALALDVKC